VGVATAEAAQSEMAPEAAWLQGLRRAETRLATACRRARDVSCTIEQDLARSGSQTQAKRPRIGESLVSQRDLSSRLASYRQAVLDGLGQIVTSTENELRALAEELGDDPAPPGDAEDQTAKERRQEAATEAAALLARIEMLQHSANSQEAALSALSAEADELSRQVVMERQQLKDLQTAMQHESRENSAGSNIEGNVAYSDTKRAELVQLERQIQRLEKEAVLLKASGAKPLPEHGDPRRAAQGELEEALREIEDARRSQVNTLKQARKKAAEAASQLEAVARSCASAFDRAVDPAVISTWLAALGTESTVRKLPPGGVERLNALGITSADAQTTYA